MNGGKGALAIGVLAAVMASGAVARAETPSLAEQLFEQGRRAMAGGDYALARARFEDSERAEPAVGTLLNLAVCEEKLGLLNAAVARLGEGLERSAPGDPRRPSIALRRDELLARVPHVILRAKAPLPAGVSVLLDGKRVETASLGTPLAVDPGGHAVACASEHGSACAHRLEVGEREASEWWIELDAPVSAAAGPAGAPAPRLPAPSPAPRSRALATWTGAVGLTGLALSILAGAEVLYWKNEMTKHCDDGGCYREGLSAAAAGKTWSLVGTIAGSVGAIGVGASAWLLIDAQPTASPRAQVLIRGSF